MLHQWQLGWALGTTNFRLNGENLITAGDATVLLLGLRDRDLVGDTLRNGEACAAVVEAAAAAKGQIPPGVPSPAPKVAGSWVSPVSLSPSTAQSSSTSPEASGTSQPSFSETDFVPKPLPAWDRLSIDHDMCPAS